MSSGALPIQKAPAGTRTMSAPSSPLISRSWLQAGPREQTMLIAMTPNRMVLARTITSSFPGNSLSATVRDRTLDREISRASPANALRGRRALQAGWSLHVQPIAHSGFRQNVARIRWLGLELSPQLRHMDAQDVRILGVGSPHLTQEVSMREDLAGIAHENGKQSVLDRRQMQLAAPDEDVAVGQIDLELTDGEGGLAVNSR